MNSDYSSSHEVHLSMNSQNIYVSSSQYGHNNSGQKQINQKSNKRRQVTLYFNTFL